MNFKEVEKILLKDGWVFLKSRGSHRFYTHPIKKGKITIPFHGGKDLAPKTLNTILKQAGLK